MSGDLLENVAIVVVGIDAGNPALTVRQPGVELVQVVDADSHQGEVQGPGGGVGRQQGLDTGWRGLLCLLWKEFGSQNFVNRMISIRKNVCPETWNLDQNNIIQS